MCCSHGYGGYKIFVDDVLMVEGGNFNNYDYRKFGTCPGGDFTSKPTNLITEHPTDRPTFRPTRRPTYRPTSRPTRRPTYVPTSRPTAGSPTHRPTAKQTERPTFRPTLRPTHRPTLRPTSRPTAGSPTGRPTAKKTGLPTHRPTDRPTLRPTNRPTDEPTTARPTHPLKTGNPTNRPTQMPITPRPTFRPTSTPTIGIPDKTSILIMIAFDNYPEDISWSLVNTCHGSSVKIAEGVKGQYTTPRTTVQVYNDVTPNGSFMFRINDAFGDGLCCNYGIGSYTILVDTDIVFQSDFKGTNGVPESARHEIALFGSADLCGPSASPTLNPTSKPTVPPTDKPTNRPTEVPTSKPTNLPTQAPTFPVTNKPTNNPTFENSPKASYSVSLGVPACGKFASALASCTTLGTGLLNSKTGAIHSKTGADDVSEMNGPNTVDSCTDGPWGRVYTVDETIEAITVSGVDGLLEKGARAKVTARIIAYGEGFNEDRVDFYFTSNPGPTARWKYFGTKTPPRGGVLNIESHPFTIPDSPQVAVRVSLRWVAEEPTAGPCVGGFGDKDDLVFAVDVSSSRIVPEEPEFLPKPETDLEFDCGLFRKKRRCVAADDYCVWRGGRCRPLFLE